MRHWDPLGGRSVDVGILRALERVGPQPVTASELASSLAASVGSVAPALQSLVKAGLVERYWGDLRSVRTYVVTDAGREYLDEYGDVAHATRR
jgi:DNA-binding MarR family transcriptional regulator